MPPSPVSTRKLTLKQLQALQEKIVPPVWYWIVGVALYVIWINSNFAATARIYLKGILILTFLMVLYGLLDAIKRHRKSFFIAISVLVLAIWVCIVESYRNPATLAWDAAGAAFGIGAAFLVWQCALAVLGWWWPLSRRARHPSTPSLVIVAILCAWGGISMASYITGRPLQPDPQRLASISEGSLVPEESRRWSTRRVGIALSGGGYRAAVFHAGTLSALETLGIRADALSTVSGGSIIGAYYALGGDPADFVKAVRDGRFSVPREMLAIQNAARLLVPLEFVDTTAGRELRWSFDRADIQANLLRRTLFRTAGNKAGSSTLKPELMLAATDLAFGLAIGMLDDGFLTLTPSREGHVFRNGKYRYHEKQELYDLADRVTISGAFPMAFPSRPLDMTIVPVSATGGPRKLQLADGGIFDNLGQELLTAAGKLACSGKDIEDSGWMPAKQWCTEVTVVSDASAIFGVESDISSFGALSRAFDVVGLKGSQAWDREMNLVRLSARGIAQEVDLGAVFLAAGSSSPEKINEMSQRRRFDPRDGYPPQVLLAIGNSFSPPDREHMTGLISHYLEESAGGRLDQATHRKWSRYLSRTRTVEDCRKLPAGEVTDLPGICDAIEMRALVAAQISDGISAFRQIATLDSWPKPDLIDRVYRFGRLLVYLQWHDLRCAMDGPSVESPQERAQRCALGNLPSSSSGTETVRFQLPAPYANSPS